MPLTLSEIRAGAIAYLDPHTLIAQPEVEFWGPNTALPGSPPASRPTPRPGPFLCVEADGAKSVWVPLTTQASTTTDTYPRRPVDPRYLFGAYGKLASGQTFLSDGAASFRGPNSAFVAAAAGEQPFPTGSRPTLSINGLIPIRVEIANQEYRAIRFIP